MQNIRQSELPENLRGFRKQLMRGHGLGHHVGIPLLSSRPSDHEDRRLRLRAWEVEGYVLWKAYSFLGL